MSRTIIPLLLLFASLFLNTVVNGGPITRLDMSPREKLQALIDAGLPPQILVSTDLERGDSDSLKKVSEDVIEGLNGIGVDATVGFYLNMLAMFTIYAKSLTDGLEILSFLDKHEHIAFYEVDTITYPDPDDDREAIDLLDDNVDPPHLVGGPNSQIPVLHHEDVTTTSLRGLSNIELRRS